MISEEGYQKAMYEWADWCCIGGVGVRGYPKAAPFVQDRVDGGNTIQSVALIDDYPMIEKIEIHIAGLRVVDPLIPDVLRAQWEAHPRWHLLKQSKKTKLLGLSSSAYYEKLGKGNMSVRTFISCEWRR